jgi:DNA-binding MurR/RpiR family transcriptional regulator
VVRFFQENREEVLVGSAASLAAKIGTSDVTVIRTAQALGYSGLDELRRDIAHELRMSLSPAVRPTRTLGAVKGDASSALAVVIDIHVQALEKLRTDISTAQFEAAIELLANARRVVVPLRIKRCFVSTHLSYCLATACIATEFRAVNGARTAACRSAA